MGNATKIIPKHILGFVKEHKDMILVSIIIFFSLCFRFWNYSDRSMFNQDDARDMIIVKYALESKTLPEIGPPASPGPFSFGPVYYWFLMLVYSFSFGISNGPWIIFTLISSLMPVALYFWGKVERNRTFGLMIGLMGALATLEVENAVGLTNPLVSGYFSFLAFFLMAIAIKRRSILLAFFYGLCVGIAVTSHYHAAVLLATIPVSSIFVNRKKLKYFLSSSLGTAISFLPILVFDFKHNFIWTKSILDYLLNGQKKFYLPVRWLTDLKDFWPELIGKTMVNNTLMGYFIIGLCLVALLMSIKKRRFLTKVWGILIVFLVLQILALRYYKGPRSPIYLVSTHALIIYFTSWSVYVIFRLQKYLGSLLFLFLLIQMFFADINILKSVSQRKMIISIKKELLQKEPGFYDFYGHPSSRMLSLPLLYTLYQDGLIRQDGKAIAACDNFWQKEDKCEVLEESLNLKDRIISQKSGYRLYNIAGIPKGKLINSGLEEMLPKTIYNWIYINYPQSKL